MGIAKHFSCKYYVCWKMSAFAVMLSLLNLFMFSCFSILVNFRLVLIWAANKIRSRGEVVKVLHSDSARSLKLHSARFETQPLGSLLVLALDRTWISAMYVKKEGCEVSPFKLGPPVIQGSYVPPFSLSILHMIPWNSLNIEMDEEHIRVGSTIQTNRKRNASSRKDFEQ